ncbi:hypothetical protein JCM6882_009149 [Rhodosporidiobolus microsporus]
MRNLSTLIGLGGLLSTTVSAFSLHDHLGLEARHHKLLARAAPKCTNGFRQTPDKTSCYCPTGKYTSVSGAKCLPHCSSGSYIQPGNPACQACPEENWLRCSSASVATACKDGSFLSNGACVEHCPTGTWEDDAPGKNRCRPCADEDATSCSNSKQGSATACLTKYLFEGLCIDAEDIPDGFFPNTATHTADTCADGVATCDGNGEGAKATSCKPGRFLTKDGKCETSCPSGSYGHKELHACLACDSSAKTCDADGAIECAKTQEGSQLYLTPHKNCILSTKGESGYYPDDATNSFKECDEGVSSCIGSGAGNALACGKLADDTPLFWTVAAASSNNAATRHRKRGDSTPIAGSCIEAEECPDGTWADSVTSACVACDEDEASCKGNGAGSALTCKENLFLDINNDCVSAEKCKASGAFFPDSVTNACSTCDPGEASCDGNGRGLANSCAKNDNGDQLYLYERNCVVATDCPGNYYPDQTELACKPCDPFVLQCKGPGQALACGVNSNSTQLYLNIDGTCVDKRQCDNSTYADPRARECASCTYINPDAKTCTSPFTLSCSSLFYQDADCVPADKCVTGTFGKESTHTCSSCFEFGLDVKTCDKDGALSCYTGSLEDHRCVSKCSTGKFTEDQICYNCTARFESATSCEADVATGCGGEKPLLQNGICVVTCSDGYYDAEDGSCQLCSTPFPNSVTCTKAKPLTCAETYVISGVSCESNCDDGQYPVDGSCTDCPSSPLVATCDTDGTPLSCDGTAYTVRGSSPVQCVESCEGLAGRFDDGDGGCELCSEVIENASECSNSRKATACTAPFVLFEDKCETEECPKGFVDQDGVCVACSSLFPGATSCDLEAPKTCETVLNGAVCAGECDSGAYDKDGVCTTCPQEHATRCTADEAQECSSPFLLHQGACVETCEGASYKSDDGRSCIDCATKNAASCSATATSSCLSPYLLLDGKCDVTVCPSGYRQDDGKCIACPSGGAECTAEKITKCVSGRVLYAGACNYPSCPTNYWYNDNGVCKACTDERAKTCNNQGKSLTCKDNNYILEQTGVCTTGQTCPSWASNAYHSTYRSGNICKSCGPGVLKCNDNGSADFCFQPSGDDMYYLYNGSCIKKSTCMSTNKRYVQTVSLYGAFTVGYCQTCDGSKVWKQNLGRCA